jgi:3-hydroxyisobutyrate dehydrogenase-like beta-hydroxyacid dehydrogenase
MVGGHPRATDAVTPLLKLMGKDAIYCGKHGAGEAASMLQNSSCYSAWA